MLQTTPRWEERFDKTFENIMPYREHKRVKAFIASIEDETVKRLEAKYKGIFQWLCGESGDFPDLSTKPHYRFRTELRERLSSLTPEDMKTKFWAVVHKDDGTIHVSGFRPDVFMVKWTALAAMRNICFNYKTFYKVVQVSLTKSK